MLIATEAIRDRASRAVEVPKFGQDGLLTSDHDNKSSIVPPDARLGVAMAASGLSWPEGNLQFCVASLLEVESADKEGRQPGSSATGHGSVQA